MSFLKIEDPKKRDEVVKKFLQMKKNIQKSDLEQKTGEQEYARRTEKFFKPLKEPLQEVKEGIAESLKPIQPAITYPQPQLSIEAPSREQLQSYGPISGRYLMKLGEKGSKADTTFGIYYMNHKPHIGNKEIKISGNDLEVAGKTYEGTPGLWELIVSKEPDPDKFDDYDFENYKEIMISTGAMYQNNNPSSGKAKSSKSIKWKNYVSPIWKEYKGQQTRRPFIRQSSLPAPTPVHLSSDPQVLFDRLVKLRAEYEAGNTGVQNEISAISDELYRQKVFSDDEYKLINESFSGLTL